jgi:hypothetical protein
VAGILFALLYLSYGSIWPGVFVHAVHNLITFIPAVRERAFLRDPATVDKWSAWSVELVLAAAFIPLAIWLFARLVASPGFPRAAIHVPPGNQG